MRIFAPPANARVAVHRAFHALVCTLACGCVWYPAYTNQCGDKPIHKLTSGTSYVEITSTGESARPLLTLVGVQLGMIGSALAAVELPYGRATYGAFALVWASIMITWHSPCGDHSLSPGFYMALASTVAAAFAVLITPE